MFQPSEERYPGGAAEMIAAGALLNVDSIIGAHLWQSLSIGTLGLTYGPMPHQAVDALLVGAQIAVALNTIVSRNVDPMEQAVISLGTFKAGDAFNIIPDTAILTGTVPSFNENMRTLLFNRIEQITSGLCLTAGATFIFHKFLGYPPVINHP